MTIFRDTIICAGVAALLLLIGACMVGDPPPEPEVTTTTRPTDPAIERGEHVWFKNTYGGEKFFAFLANHPDPAKRIQVGFDAVVNTPRNARFDVWGVINDPDCTANPAGGMDLCDDPASSGVVGIRKSPGPGGTTMFGVACAACHAGFDPTRPPKNANEPTWDNIHPSIGNQYLKVGAIFGANLGEADPRAIMFAAWPDGAVDTTLLFNDNIMNPGVMTAFWEHPNRPTFDVGMDTPKPRNGQGGEDDVGGDLAALRVYTNIGVCFAECVAGPAATGAAISIDQCRANCPDFPPQSDLDDLVAFLGSIDSPRYWSWRELSFTKFVRGYGVFEQNCADCHDNDGRRAFVLSNDEVIPLAEDPENNTNACRALTSNWEAGRIWGEFSSQVYKDRVTAGDRGYRVMPLSGVWSTAPFLHNQSIGENVRATASVVERGANYERAMRELLSRDRPVKMNTLPVAVGPFPAGTPLTYVFSRDPATGELLCNDAIENRGHYYGADLSEADKDALIHYVKFQ